MKLYLGYTADISQVIGEQTKLSFPVFVVLCQFNSAVRRKFQNFNAGIVTEKYFDLIPQKYRENYTKHEPLFTKEWWYNHDFGSYHFLMEWQCKLHFVNSYGNYDNVPTNVGAVWQKEVLSTYKHLLRMRTTLLGCRHI